MTPLLAAPRVAGLLCAPKPPVIESPLKSPYPYFGGKSTVADVVWRRFGDVPNYCEPFFGSGAMLLSRPAKHLERNRIETVNDKDGMISNFWRAVKYNAETVAEYADWPVNENDLHARHAWLVGQRETLTARLEGDPGFFDAKIAGWWVWGMSCWLGGGFCDGSGPWHVVNGKLVNVREMDSAGVVGQRPHLTNSGQGIIADGAGVPRRRPQLHNEQGVSRKRLNLNNSGRGAAGQLPYLKSAQGVSRQARRLSASQGVVRKTPELKSLRGDSAQRTTRLYDYFDQLSARLRRVRVCSGDWSRIIGPSATFGIGLTAVFLDPPYSHDERDTSLYATDSRGIDAVVRAWAIEHGDNPLLHIAYCGYDDGTPWPAGWTLHRWRANGGYANQGDGPGKDNKHRECIWFSPHCIPVEKHTQLALFDTKG